MMEVGYPGEWPHAMRRSPLRGRTSVRGVHADGYELGVVILLVADR